MNIKSFITQSNTIYSGSEINAALNPIVDLFYGDGFSRYIFKVDISKIKEKFEKPVTTYLIVDENNKTIPIVINEE